MTVIGPVRALAAADGADGIFGRGEVFAKAGAPLAQELDGGDDDERADAEAGDGAEGDDGLASAGGQHDDAASVVAQPGVYGGDLVWARLEIERWREGQGVVGEEGGRET